MLITLLIWLLILLIVVAVIFYVLSLLPIPQPWLNIFRAVIALLVLLVLLSYVVPLTGHPLLR